MTDFLSSPTPYAAIIAAVAVITLGRAILSKREDKAEWKGRTDESVTTLKETTKKIEDHLLKLVEHFIPGTVLEKSSSPVTLTERGEDVSNYLGAKEWARNKAAELAPSLDVREAFEIYEFTKEYVESTPFDDDFQRQMKRTAYEKGVTVEQVRSLLAIELRDALIEHLPD